MTVETWPDADALATAIAERIVDRLSHAFDRGTYHAK